MVSFSITYIFLKFCNTNKFPFSILLKKTLSVSFSQLTPTYFFSLFLYLFLQLIPPIHFLSLYLSHIKPTFITLLLYEYQSILLLPYFSHNLSKTFSPSLLFLFHFIYPHFLNPFSLFLYFTD